MPRGHEKLNDGQRALIAADRITSKKELARRYGVNARLIDFIQDPEKYHANNEHLKAYRKQWRADHPPLAKRGYKKKVKPIPLNPYAKAIQDAIEQGIGSNDIEWKLNETLTQLVRNRLEIDKQIEEVRLTQNALFEFLQITPVLMDELEIVERKNEAIIYMTAKEMRSCMTECGLTVKRLALEMGKKYSARSLQAYRNGEVSVPRDVAELLRGFPRKSHVEYV